MELKEQAPAATLAHRLGDTAHVSGLAIRLARLSGAGDRLPEWLLKTAVERGAKHYQRDFDPSLPPDNPAISDEEIGIALCLGQMPDDPWFIRAAAQLLSSPRVDPQRLVRLAKMERVEPVLLHVAAAGERVGETQEPWATLRRQLHPRRTVRAEAGVVELAAADGADAAQDFVLFRRDDALEPLLENRRDGQRRPHVVVVPSIW